jgi:hypothetical protein
MRTKSLRLTEGLLNRVVTSRGGRAHGSGIFRPMNEIVDWNRGWFPLRLVHGMAADHTFGDIAIALGKP